MRTRLGKRRPRFARANNSARSGGGFQDPLMNGMLAQDEARLLKGFHVQPRGGVQR
jgi:hypothetical protein